MLLLISFNDALWCKKISDLIDCPQRKHSYRGFDSRGCRGHGRQYSDAVRSCWGVIDTFTNFLSNCVETFLLLLPHSAAAPLVKKVRANSLHYLLWLKIKFDWKFSTNRMFIRNEMSMQNFQIGLRHLLQYVFSQKIVNFSVNKN